MDFTNWIQQRRLKKIFRRRHKEFSKVLLIQESALIWILSFGFLLLAFYCVRKDYVGSLPWITAMVGLPWTAYGVSQGFYYNKSKAENTEGGIKFENMKREAEYTPAAAAEKSDELDPFGSI